MCRLLPRSRGLPRYAGGSASAPLLSRPAQASLTLRPVGLLGRPRRPLSRGFDPAGRPTKPLVSYQSNRQLSGWNLPPLVIRAIGAHCKNQEFCRVVLTVGVLHLLSFHAVQPKPLISAPARPDGRRARAGRGRSIAGTFAR